MTRKPGDYVVNAELTDEQREWFVADCVAAGAISVSAYNPGATYTVMTVPNGEEVRKVGSIGDCGLDNRTNVTDSYKPQPMTQPQLMRQIADAMERNPEGWWREFEQPFMGGRTWGPLNGPEDALDSAIRHPDLIRPKPRTYTLHIEDMPEPLREEQKIGRTYWWADPETIRARDAVWTDAEIHKHRLKAGLCYPDETTAREALEKLTRAMGGE